MPHAAPKPCSHAACGVLVRDGSSRCPKHKAAAWAKAPGQVKRRTGRALQRDRGALFAREPLCRACDAKGEVRLATIRDHVKPLAEGGLDDDSNVQPLCQACSDEKTAAESARGVRRSFHGRPPGGVQISGAPKPETDLLVKFLRAQDERVGGVVPKGGER
jgi:5-methylcytosine-specific restriction protein A